MVTSSRCTAGRLSTAKKGCRLILFSDAKTNEETADVQEEEMFAVEEILERRVLIPKKKKSSKRKKNPIREYLVKWEGHGPEV